jgi:hypothetical protein
MEYILGALKCITPCISPLAALIGCILTVGIIRTRIIYRGPMPSDGPEEGFASKAARVEYFSTSQQRYSETVKAIIIWIVIGILASVIVWLATIYNVEITTNGAALSVYNITYL